MLWNGRLCWQMVFESSGDRVHAALQLINFWNGQERVVSTSPGAMLWHKAKVQL